MEGILGVFFIMLGFCILLLFVICIIENENSKLKEIVRQNNEEIKYLKIGRDK